MNAWRTARRVVAGLGALAFLATATACGEEPKFLGRTRVNVAYKNDQPGTSYWDKGKYSGFDSYVGAHVTQQLKVTHSPKLVTSDLRETEITGGLADLVIATYSITPQRAEEVAFVGPYAVTDQGYMVMAGSGRPVIESESDLKDKNICTMTSTTAVENLRRQGLNNVKEVSSASTCVDLLLGGKTDAFFMDEMILYGFQAAKPEKGLRIFKGKAGEPQFYGIGMPKRHLSDCENLKKIVKAYVQSGQWTTDFTAALPEFTKGHPTEVEEHRPSPGLLDKLSCRG
ncbi:transporter substrate-binding domain-containing protein [Kitasatospora sp. NPDC091335]|uniref:transporter substrate-binding domain-containing protein n=1 Tax=Kitasatospora sp. NPDC091335 TaxID=3364085 RepID=UPI0037F63027